MQNSGPIKAREDAFTTVSMRARTVSMALRHKLAVCSICGWSWYTVESLGRQVLWLRGVMPSCNGCICGVLLERGGGAAISESGSIWTEMMARAYLLSDQCEVKDSPAPRNNRSCKNPAEISDPRHLPMSYREHLQRRLCNAIPAIFPCVAKFSARNRSPPDGNNSRHVS